MTWNEALEKLGTTLNVEVVRIGATTVTPLTVIAALCIVLGTIWGSRAIRRTLERRLERRGGSAGTVGAVTSLVHYGVLSAGLAVAAQTIGIDLTALFAAGAVFAVGFGFAMQNIAQNFVSGIILLVERSIRPGDIINVEGRVVKILRMGIRATVVETRDSEEVILPNSNLVQSAVTNYTLRETVYRMWFRVGVSYASDMVAVRNALLTAASKVEEALAGRPPEVLLVEFGDNAVLFEVGVWIGDPWRVRALRADLADKIWWSFQEAGITIAYPQLDVHFDPPVGGGLAALAERAA
jgi:potassium-dependent mechanosensitive channel